jgi:hypothetical protein
VLTTESQTAVFGGVFFGDHGRESDTNWVREAESNPTAKPCGLKCRSQTLQIPFWPSPTYVFRFPQPLPGTAAEPPHPLSQKSSPSALTFLKYAHRSFRNSEGAHITKLTSRAKCFEHPN